MNIYKGNSNLDATWQDTFSPTATCDKCGANCRIMFTAIEEDYEDDKESGFICDLHDNMKDGKYWLHDACAVAVYLCEMCFTAHAEVNQA